MASKTEPYADRFGIALVGALVRGGGVPNSLSSSLSSSEFDKRRLLQRCLSSMLGYNLEGNALLGLGFRSPASRSGRGRLVAFTFSRGSSNAPRSPVYTGTNELSCTLEKASIYLFLPFLLG